MATRCRTAPPPQWSDFELQYGQQLVEDLVKVTTVEGAQRRTAQGLGIRHFLRWLAEDQQPAAQTLRRVLVNADLAGLSELQAVQLLASAINRWISETLHARNISPTTFNTYAHTTANTLEALGDMPERRYPPYMRRLVSLPTVVGDVRTLGRLQWPEFEGIAAQTARERIGLDLVRSAAVAEFEWHERFFRFGQEVLAGTVALGDSGDTLAMRTLLEAERGSWETTGRSQFDPSNAISPKVAALLHRLFDTRIWEKAGLTVRSRRQMMRKIALQHLALMCCGPTFHCTMMVAIAFCCDTGWNRQPILDLPRNPFLFQTQSECGVGTAAFVESFKRRANHEVLAYLESSTPLSGLAEERVRSEWNGAANEFDPGGGEDGVATIGREAPLIDILRRYQQMTDTVRAFDRNRTYERDFFVYLTQTDGLFRSSSRTVRENGRGTVLSRDGVTFRSLRKTFLSLRVRETGSVTATQTIAGHTSGHVLMPHYLNDADITAELDQSIRFFQNACQALILNDLSIVVKLDISDYDIEWFRRLADASGIGVAVGWNPQPADAQSRSLSFSPSDDNLRDLFLAHKALRAARHHVHSGRWLVQGLPLLAAVKAIGRTVMRKGLREAYRVAARSAAQELKSGRITLPPVLEG